MTCIKYLIVDGLQSFNGYLIDFFVYLVVNTYLAVKETHDIMMKQAN